MPMVQKSMNGFDFLQTTRVIFGVNSLDQLGGVAKELGATRALLVTDAGIINAGYAERAQDTLRKDSIESVLFSDVDENPTTTQVEAGVEVARKIGGIDLIVGLGGGSPMDCAKGINFLLTNGGRMEDYWGFNKATKPMLPSIGVPTTAGTGSEAQSYALISQKGTHTKMACGDVKARFRAVILDPALTVTAPKGVTAVSGIDAIAHAVETYVTKNRNPLTQMYSAEAWRLLSQNFETVLQEPVNVPARASMLLGAHFAGIAIEYSMLGAAHACANPLTSRYRIAHGVAVGLMLPAVIRFNQAEVAKEYRQLSDDLLETILELKRIASLPQKLSEFQVERNALPELARDAATQWTSKHNPRSLIESDFLALYESTF
ncbi:iron-containing alcohol dehydrogenase [bacterium]|nr:iron-containing alcohol dehydrogenase [bacterium]